MFYFVKTFQKHFLKNSFLGTEAAEPIDIKATTQSVKR